MAKMKSELIERRKFIRLVAPIKVTYGLIDDLRIRTTTCKNISAEGISFEVTEKGVRKGDAMEIKMDIPGVVNPVHAKGKVAWINKESLADDAALNAGVEFTEIEEDNKNTFLKFLCDLMYTITKGD